jgi:hypothetical protein
MFRAGPVLIPRPGGELPLPAPSTLTAAEAPPPAAPAPPSATQWITARVVAGGAPVELRFLPIDMGEPALMFDGNTHTLMRGAGDNPYLIELRFDPPALVSSFDLDVGYMPEFEVSITATGTDGKEIVVNDHQHPVPGSAPHSELALPGGPLELASALVSIRDIREIPGEGWHIHIFELGIGRGAQRAPREPR